MTINEKILQEHSKPVNWSTYTSSTGYRDLPSFCGECGGTTCSHYHAAWLVFWQKNPNYAPPEKLAAFEADVKAAIGGSEK